tara:strand:+ start:1060 stop:2685 length:1626 start_codon:yes stop_codon:yes gene_type:complete
MKSILLIILIFSSAAFAQIDIKFRPERPVVDESFNMEVVIAFDGNDEPFITFDPGGLTVESKRKGGVTFSTQLINGQFTSQKTISYIYELKSNRSGVFYLRNFSAKFSDKEFKEDNIRVQVLREAEKPKDYFLEAIPSKENVYKGEGFFVNYFLYTRVPIYNQELKEYPKLNGFLKRFKAVDETPERIERNGLIYQRSKKYSAKLFAEKTGKLLIDPLKIQVAVGFGNRGGFGLRDMRNVTLSSDPVDIQSSSTPGDNVPAGFTGLIGEHTFNLVLKKNKFLVNEPIELSLEVIGPGLLEKMDDPVLYSHPDLESFDTRSEIQELSENKSRKILEYTYLPRSSLTIEARELSLSIFDPADKTYKSYSIAIPEIQVVGGAAPSVTSTNPKSINTITPSKEIEVTPSTLTPVSPFYSSQKFKGFISIYQLSLIISFLIFIFALFTNVNRGENTRRNHATYYFKKHLSKGIDYKSMYQFLTILRDDNKQELEQVIEKSDLGSEIKEYFRNLLDSLRQNNYSLSAGNNKIKPDKKMFKKLIKKIN